MDGLTMGPGREIVVTAIGIGSGSRGGGHVLDMHNSGII